MNNYEKQLQSAADKDVLVIENWDMGNDSDHEPIDGLYIDGCVALSDDLKTTAEKNVTLAEELAHHDLTVGDILDTRDAANRRQEQKARTLSYDRLIGLSGLARAISAGCENRFEVAEYLEVTEPFLQEAIDRYKEIYGPKFATYIEEHLKDGAPVQKPVAVAPEPEPAAAEQVPPPFTPEEIQQRIEQIRKRKKKLAAKFRRAMKRAELRESLGHDPLLAEHERFLDPDR